MTEWLGNAEVYERNRAAAQRHADRAREQGDEELAAQLEGYAETHRQARDKEQRMEERRRLNRRTFRRRW